MSEKDHIVETFTELAPRYEQVVDSELRSFWGWSYGDFVDQIIDSITLKQGDIVLDIATGTAVIPRRLVDRNQDAQKLFGLDLTFAMLQRGKTKLQEKNAYRRITLVCASALDIPFKMDVFDVIVCALATHHMDVQTLMKNIHRIVKPGGSAIIADVSASPSWRLLGIKLVLRVLTFLYFIFKEGFNRAIAEAKAVTNVRTSLEWQDLLQETGFSSYEIASLPSSRSWIPAPMIVQARK